jgi:putative ABC transport system permease protein
MNAAVLVLRNLARNKLRTTLTVVATALPAAFFLLTTAVRDVLDATIRKVSAELRLGVHNRVSIFNMMPARARAVIESLDPERRLIEAVCGMRWFGGVVEGRTPFPFGTVACDTDTWPRVFSEYEPSPAEIAEWHRHKNACVVGQLTADHYGWRLGGEFELRSSVPPFMRMRFRIVQLHTGPNARIMFCRMDYLDDMIKAAGGEVGRVNLYWVKVKDAAKMEGFARTVDDAFANTPDETKSEDESTIVASIIKSRGDLPGKLQIVGTVAVLANIIVVANTMALAFRERTGETAVLRALGFSTAWVARTVVAESLLLTVLGGLAGILPTWLFFQLVPVQDLGLGPMPRFLIPERSVAYAAAAVVLVGIAAGLAPALRSRRLRPADALRKVG